MKLVGILVAAVALAGCSKLVEVRIHPDSYQVGPIKSELATPAVDEVVRLNPKEVVTVFCLNTPPAKVRQFVTELQARSKAKITGRQPTEGC